MRFWRPGIKIGEKSVFFGIFLFIFLPYEANAFCPLCMVATGFFAGMFRWMGLDDTIIGLWLGSFIFSSFYWARGWIRRNLSEKYFLAEIGAAVSVLMFLFFLYVGGAVSPGNDIWGVNKIFAGIFLGALAMAVVPLLNNLIKKLNGGALFSRQRIALSLAMLLVITLFLKKII